MNYNDKIRHVIAHIAFTHHDLAPNWTFDEVVEKAHDINERDGFLIETPTERENWVSIGYIHLDKAGMEVAISKAKILADKLAQIKKSEDYLKLPKDYLQLQ